MIPSVKSVKAEKMTDFNLQRSYKVLSVECWLSHVAKRGLPGVFVQGLPPVCLQVQTQTVLIFHKLAVPLNAFHVIFSIRDINRLMMNHS